MIIFLVKSVFPLQPDNNMSLLTLLNNYIWTCCMFKHLLDSEKLRMLATLHIYVSVLICSTSLWPPMTIITSSVRLNVKLKRKSFLSAAFFSDGHDGNGRTHKAHRPLRPQLLHRRDCHHFQPFLLECGKTFLYMFFFLHPLCSFFSTKAEEVHSTVTLHKQCFYIFDKTSLCEMVFCGVVPVKQQVLHQRLSSASPRLSKWAALLCFVCQFKSSVVAVFSIQILTAFLLWRLQWVMTTLKQNRVQSYYITLQLSLSSTIRHKNVAHTVDWRYSPWPKELLQHKGTECTSLVTAQFSTRSGAS